MKTTTLLLALLSLPLLLAFTVPGLQERKNAVGNLRGLSPKFRAVFEVDDTFKPIPEPGYGDWLNSQKEAGQTYQQFLNSRPNRPGQGGRKFIYLQPIGDFPKEAPKLKTLKNYLEIYFHPMPVKLAKKLTVKDENSTIRKRGDQWNCRDILRELQKRVPRDAHVVMAVTMTDLYPDDQWNFVFGMAQLRHRCGVFSFARYESDKDLKLALKRAMKVISHETGHAFGIKHCTHFHCLMNGSNGMSETDRAPLYFCPSCLRKIHWGLKFDPVKRYAMLADFLKKQDMADEAVWFEKRIEKIKGAVK